AGATFERAFAAVPIFAPLGIRSWVHLVLGRDPAAASTLEKLRDGFVDTGGREHDRSACAVKYRAFRESMKARDNLTGTPRTRVAGSAGIDHFRVLAELRRARYAFRAFFFGRPRNVTHGSGRPRPGPPEINRRTSAGNCRIIRGPNHRHVLRWFAGSV